MATPERTYLETQSAETAVKTVFYRKAGPEGSSGRVSVRTLREMIAHWEIGPDDFIRLEGDAAERRVREYPALSPLDDMLQEAARKLFELRRGKGRRAEVIQALERLLEYAEKDDRVYSVACMLLGYLRYAENPTLARGLFLKALERGYPFTGVVRNNLAVSQIRLGDPAGRDNLILAANDPQRPPAALMNLARLLQHLQAHGENTEAIANVKDLLRAARAEWQKSPPVDGSPASLALFLCEGDIPATFASETRAISKAQGQIEDILAEAEDCLRQGRLEQAMAHAARAASELELVREELERAAPEKGLSPLRFLSVRLARLEKESQAAKEARERQAQLDVFRSRLRAIEESLRLKIPPADLIHQAEILLDSSRSEGERAEAAAILRECQDRVARHLLDTANELLASGEKDVALGLLNRALTLDSRVSEEIRLRIASIRRDELEEEIGRLAAAGAFEEAKAKIALLRTMHPVFEPVALRLESEVRNREAAALVERVVELAGTRGGARESVEEARRLFELAKALSEKPESLGPIEDELRKVEARHGIRRGGAFETKQEGEK